MQKDQLKMNIHNFVLSAFNTIFPPETNIYNNLINSTGKVIYNQKKYLINDFVDMLADKNGNIDIDMIKQEYESALFKDGKLEIDLQDISDKFNLNLPSILTNKTLIFTKDEIMKIFQ